MPPHHQTGRFNEKRFQRRKLEIDGQVDTEPEHRFDERITLIEVVEALKK